MTPSPTPQRKKKDDYDHPLRRSPRGEAAPPRQAKTEGHSPAQLAVERAGTLEAIPFDRANYETVTEAARLADLLDAARYQGHFAFRVKLNSSDAMHGEIAGVALALVPGHAAYVPLAHRASDGLDLGGETVAQIPMREALDLLKPILEDASVLKIVQNAKFDMVALARYGIALQTIDDPCLISYALDAGRAEHLPGQLAGNLLGYTCLTEKDVVGSGRAAGQLRPRAHRRASRICRRGDRYRPAALARAQAAPRGRVRDHGLRDAGAAARAGAGRDGARRRQGRAGDARLAVRLVRPDHRAARGRDQGSLPARTSISARPSSSARSCSTR